jgi:hypothetical protein
MRERRWWSYARRNVHVGRYYVLSVTRHLQNLQIIALGYSTVPV